MWILIYYAGKLLAVIDTSSEGYQFSDFQHSTVCHTTTFSSGLLLDTIHDEPMNELVEKSESIFTVNFLMDNFAIFNICIAKEIILVFNEIFYDIDQVELMSASVDNIVQVPQCSI